ncbi:ABC transporter permease (plasmid) [Deinococcus psychrotolerans]|uniref:ABC transporter permease n=1 Tax=Deinococcus psychrotolerans TaxID=2489213 RepID=A0A3G8YI43_9DEIO|nr:ABC transporter permease [Deinococcus psychrotolerans]AZI44938.1 ABC transporter permease [Deinococcus psychrotolerans]
MLSYLARRLLTIVPVLLGITVIAYFLTRTIPGDAVAILLGTQNDPVVAAQLRHNLHLDQPVILGYFDWLSQVLRGHLGQSIRSGADIGPDLVQRFARSAQLSLAAILLAVVVGIPAGIAAAVRRNRWPDQLISVAALLGISTPDFWLGTILVLVFSLQLQWLPPAGYVPPSSGVLPFLKVLLLPALTLGLQIASIITRFTRAAMLDVLTQDYVRTARAKGQTQHRIFYGHALKNAAIPILTVIGLNFGFLLGGTVIVETIFSWPGVGNLVLTAINQRDYPVVQACVMLFAITFTLINLAIDLLYGLVDPRVRYS